MFIAPKVFFRFDNVGEKEVEKRTTIYSFIFSVSFFLTYLFVVLVWYSERSIGNCPSILSREEISQSSEVVRIESFVHDSVSCLL